MVDREPISKKARFEVFKRDSFTCQYCGAKAPDVVLHVDHIRPVADGGKSDVLSLVTACAGCNAGKGARRLDDRTTVERQRAQLEELQARREQLEAMLQWRDGLEATKHDTVQLISDRLEERGGFAPNEHGRADIRTWLRRFSFDELLTALDESFDYYMKFRGDEPDEKAWGIAFRKIPAIASLRKQSVEKPYIRKLAYIQGIIRKRFRDKRGLYIAALEEMHVTDGVPLDRLQSIALLAKDWDDLCSSVSATIAAKAE